MNIGMNTKATFGRTRRARRNLALKLMLEATFRSEVITYFNKITRLFKDRYSTVIAPLTHYDINEMTQDLLSKQYKRANKLFRDEMRLYLFPEKTFTVEEKKQDEENRKKIDETMAAASILFISKQKQERAGLLDSTTIDNMNDAIIEADNEASASEVTLTKEEILALTTIKLKRKFKGRTDTIAITETQFASESTKGMEASVVSSNGNIPPDTVATSILVTITQAVKTWATMGDDRVRPAHIAADGQRQFLTDPFVVGGELLPYPGSSALGASAGNTVRCRCSALYGIL